MPNQEQFNPYDEKYKKVEDLPKEEKENFEDVEGGGFIAKEAAKYEQKLKKEAEKRNSGRPIWDKILSRNEEFYLDIAKEKAYEISDYEVLLVEKEKKEKITQDEIGMMRDEIEKIKQERYQQIEALKERETEEEFAVFFKKFSENISDLKKYEKEIDSLRKITDKEKLNIGEFINIAEINEIKNTTSDLLKQYMETIYDLNDRNHDLRHRSGHNYVPKEGDKVEMRGCNKEEEEFFNKFKNFVEKIEKRSDSDEIKKVMFNAIVEEFYKMYNDEDASIQHLRKIKSNDGEENFECTWPTDSSTYRECGRCEFYELKSRLLANLILNKNENLPHQEMHSGFFDDIEAKVYKVRKTYESSMGDSDYIGIGWTKFKDTILEKAESSKEIVEFVSSLKSMHTGETVGSIVSKILIVLYNKKEISLKAFLEKMKNIDSKISEEIFVKLQEMEKQKP